MQKVILITLILLLIAYAMVDLAQAYTVALDYYNTVGLMDENMALLEDGCIIQLIFNDTGIISPPSPWNGRPSGDDDTSIGAGDVDPDSGQFDDDFDYDSVNQGNYVYIRFFNASTWPQVTYYRMSPLHTLNEFFNMDIWDVTDGGLYLWTEYPFMIIPEPETWLTMLPALIFAIFIFRRKRKEK